MSDHRLRQFAVTGGRTRSEEDLPLEIPISVGANAHLVPEGNPDHLEILRRLDNPQTLVDLSSTMGTPVGVIRVLVLDLAEVGAVVLHRASDAAPPPHHDIDLLEEALDGIANL